MPIDRELWNRRLNESWMPPWPCPNCLSTLSLVPKSFKNELDGRTKRYQHHEHSDPESYTGVFACLAQCLRLECKSVCAISGTSCTDTDEDGRYYASCRPICITPAIPVIKVPPKCPTSVEDEIKAAFALFWIDNSACLNRIRNALELVLDVVKIPRKRKGRDGKMKQINLHTRIEIIKARKPNLALMCERMLAVKYLGNAGSHSDDVSRDDVCDGFDILERVLFDMYSDHESVMAKMIKGIIKRKGPRKKKSHPF